MKLAEQLPRGLDDSTKAVSDNIVVPDSEDDQVLSTPADTVKYLEESGLLKDQTLATITDGLHSYQSITRPENGVLGSKCPVAKTGPSMEQDFTTNGTQGTLRCPFSKLKHDGVEKSSMQNGDAGGDPSEPEVNDGKSVQTGSVGSCSVARCPIRYLDQHSPEEVADFVEKHKREIPRSHAICVQRYQRDSHTMRNLDAKYGGLINMIQGLSEKHQAFLPGSGQNGVGSNSSAHVEKWTADVDVNSNAPAPQETEEAGSEERQGHFDRPLREIRVGESPSRPWGIPVPVADDPMSPPHSASAPAPVAVGGNSKAPGASQAPSKPAGRCPFGHDAAKKIASEAKHSDHPRQSPAANKPMQNEAGSSHADSNAKPSKMVFNGPVFFGYSADQAATMMQQLSNLGDQS